MLGLLAGLAVSGRLPFLGEDGEVVLDESGNGPDARPYASTGTNEVHELWHVEPGSAPVDRVDGKLVKVSDEQFHRFFSTRRFGGPGTTLRITYRARALEIRERKNSSIVAGTKIGLRFPNLDSPHLPDDPRSAYGTGDSSTSPGSYQFLTGLTADGYTELSRNGYAGEGYEFFPHVSLGYEPGTWREITITVEWLPGSTVRVRYWHRGEPTGPPLYEAVDAESPFADQAAFLWVRSDDTDFEYDYLIVEEFPSEGGEQEP